MRKLLLLQPWYTRQRKPRDARHQQCRRCRWVIFAQLMSCVMLHAYHIRDSTTKNTCCATRTAVSTCTWYSIEDLKIDLSENCARNVSPLTSTSKYQVQQHSRIVTVVVWGLWLTLDCIRSKRRNILLLLPGVAHKAGRSMLEFVVRASFGDAVHRQQQTSGIADVRSSSSTTDPLAWSNY